MRKEDDKYYRNDLSSLFLWHLQWAERLAEKQKNFEDAYRQALNFEKETDWKKFRACIDLFEDTEYAIISAFKFQLGYVGNKNYDLGEKNIRLYGILNAIYLQIYSIIELSKLLYYSKPKIIKNQFSNLSIYKLRGIAGSHTIDFDVYGDLWAKSENVNKKTSFRIVQAYLSKIGDKIVAIDENNITLEFNLLNELQKYIDLSTDYLKKLMIHSIETLVREEGDKIEMTQRMNEIILNMIDYKELNENEKYFKNIQNNLGQGE